MAELIPCLIKLRSEFDTIGPKRDRKSDGWIGDKAHEKSVSDHNDDETGNVPIRDSDRKHEVHAIDVDKDGPWLDGITMERAVQFLLSRCRSGAERRLRYVIFNRRIWSASSGWKQKAYTGSNPHDHHAHFSGSYESAHEASLASWHLSDLLKKETPQVVTTPSQNWAHDVDPSSGTYSAAGALWTTLVRGDWLNNTWAPSVSAKLEELNQRVQDNDDELDPLGASLALVVSLLGQVTNEPGVDPNVWYETMRKAVADELDARA